MKIQVPAHPVSGAPAYDIDPINLADRVNDIARRLDVAILAIEGAEASGGIEHLSAVVEFIQEVREQVKAVSADIHPDHRNEPVAIVEDEKAS